jgi:hypothetical protein
MKPAAFVFGQCRVPDGKQGPWRLDTFELSEDEVRLHNLRAAVRGKGYLVCPAGTYRRLWHRERGVVMSNTPMELRTNRDAFEDATGDVLIAGLGMGMLLEAVLSKADVRSVTVVENDDNIMAMVGPHFASDDRVRLVRADIHEWEPSAGQRWDYGWFDIWDDICADNAVSMRRLARRFGPRCTRIGMWSAFDVAPALQRRLTAQRSAA